jgi:hypothetical protein
VNSGLSEIDILDTWKMYSSRRNEIHLYYRTLIAITKDFLGKSYASPLYKSQIYRILDQLEVDLVRLARKLMVSRSCFTPVKDQKFVIQISTLLIVHKLREEKKEKQRLDASWNMFLFRVSDIRPYKLFSILFLEKAVQIELGK